MRQGGGDYLVAPTVSSPLYNTQPERGGGNGSGGQQQQQQQQTQYSSCYFYLNSGPHLAEAGK
jgi:hypothetical protein